MSKKATITGIKHEEVHVRTSSILVSSEHTNHYTITVQTGKKRHSETYKFTPTFKGETAYGYFKQMIFDFNKRLKLGEQERKLINVYRRNLIYIDYKLEKYE